jgi:hypothetical protein
VRTALLCGLLTALTLAVLHLPRVLSNADFIYMCAAAAALSEGALPVTPYFPPGYPALLWAVVQAGANALTAGVVLAAFGTGLTAAAVTYLARVWSIPAALALALGLLSVSLPSAFIIALNPHLDALYTGLGALLLAGGMAAMVRRPGPWSYVALLLAAVVLIGLRYHAVLLVIPLALVLTCSRRPGVRPLGLTLLLVGLAAVGATYLALHAATGSYRTASGIQVAVGSVYRSSPSEDAAVVALYDDYAGWLQQAPAPDAAMVLDGIRTNWPQFLLRRAVLAGLLLWVLGLVLVRREAPGAVWLVAFIAGYTLVVSPTYFTPRASALPEVAAVMLGAGTLSLLFAAPLPKGRRRKAARPKLDPVLAGSLLTVLALAALGYNVWREVPVLQAQTALRAQVVGANRATLALAEGQRGRIYGPLDFTGIYGTGRYNLPGATWSRLWMDDPSVTPLIDRHLPRLGPAQALAPAGPIRVIQLWPEHASPTSAALIRTLEGHAQWREVESGDPEVRRWERAD